MIRRLIIMATVFLAAQSFSCSSEKKSTGPPETVIGSGVMTTRTRTLPPFHSVILSTVGDVKITHGTPQAVSLTVDENVLPYITTTVENGILHIGADPDVGLSDFDLTVDLTMTDLEELILTGVGTIIGQNLFSGDEVDLFLTGVGDINLDLEVDRLNTTLSGVGNITLRGSVNRHKSLLSGLANIEAFDQVADTCSINSAGVGEARVYVSNLLEVSISGVGSVYYRGRPRIYQTITGIGRLIDAN